MNKLLEKVIAVLLVIVLAGANLSILGMYGISYALTDAELSGQTTTTENSNVEFNAYFEGGGHVKTENIDNTTKLFVNIKVKNTGYLKNGRISFQDVNFQITGDIQDSNVQSVDKENNVIVLKQLNNGSDVTLEIPIAILEKDVVSSDYFAKKTKTNFQGTYVDANGKEKAVSKEIVNKLSWQLGTSIKDVMNIEPSIVNCIVYPDRPRIVVQIKVIANYGKLPIKRSNIEVTIPEILQTKAGNVTVVAHSTEATNGDKEGLNFGNQNYTYTESENKITISVSNGENDITWTKGKKDEYIITCVYRSDEISDALESYNGSTNLPGSYKVTSKLEVEEYDSIKTTSSNYVSSSITDYITAEEGASLIKLETSGIDSISKGQIYANYGATNKKETSYWTRYGITCYEAQSVRGELIFTQNLDTFLLEGSSTTYPTTVSGSNYVYNKTVKVSESNFNKIFGEEGTIDVCNLDGTKIGTINKDTNKDNNGNYILDISSANNNQLKIIGYTLNKYGTATRGPIAEGKLIIEIEKAFKTNQDYSLNQMQTFANIKTGASCTSTYLDVKLDGTYYTDSDSASINIPLTEPKSVVTLDISKKDLSTVVTNENVEIRATLDTSDINYALYKNPTLKIKLPSYINKVDLKSSNILMANGLTLKSATVATENGAQVINVVLEGTQTEYTIDAEYKGTIIVLNTDLTTDTLTPSNSNKIVMEYTNANTVSTNSSGTVETNVNFISQDGVVAANGISNFAEGKADILSISNEGVTGTIATYADSRTATINGTIINNYPNKISNVVILGRIPVKDNKKIDTTESLGSTFSTTLKTNLTLTGIDSSKYTVYYSENADATTDVSNSANGWSTTATTATKSYLIVTNNYEMNAGETIKFSYDVEIPANLTHNNDVYEMYKVYYNNVSSIGTIAESKTSAIAGLTTGKGAILTAELSAVLPDGSTTVREGQTVKMKVVVKNTGSMTANNVKVLINKPENVEYVTPDTIDIGTIEAGKTKEASYSLQVASNIFVSEIVNKVEITANEVSGKISSNENILPVKKANMQISIESFTSEDTVLNTGMVIKHTIRVRNTSDLEQLNNTIVTIPLSKGVRYKDAVIKNSVLDEEGITEGITYDENSNVITANIGTLKESKVIVFNTEIKESYENISFFAKIKADGVEEQYSNVLEYATEKVELEISDLTSTPKYIKEGEIVTYQLKITNKGNNSVNNVLVSSTLPNGLSFEKATYTYAGKEQSVTRILNGKISITIDPLPAGESTTIKILAKADLLPDKNDKTIQNKMTVSAKGFNEVETNTVTNTIEYYEDAHKDQPTEPTNPNDPSIPTVNRYKITGTAWIDSNKDGKRDADESILSGISVMLLNKQDNSIVKDVDTNANKVTTTDNSGKYEFNNLPQGEYIVIFLYDASRYSLTTYQAKDVDTSLNSDVININITLEGKRTIAATTDAIKITSDNVRDIDIGVYSAEKFDLKLDKYVSKITLTTPTIGTKTYTYDNSKAGKIEVLGSNLGKSSAVIEYKIVVTNEGAIPGYVKKIVDYLPEEVGFNTELNKDWYLSENGNVYNASLANEIIKPGESKEVTLVVTKKITEDSLGPLNNNAEIYESYNEQGLTDIDSTPGNKATDEDDLSRADIIVSIVTGKIITYTTIALGVIVLLGFGIFEIKKRVLNKKNI